jgi:hypothetical protein
MPTQLRSRLNHLSNKLDHVEIEWEHKFYGKLFINGEAVTTTLSQEMLFMICHALDKHLEVVLKEN